MAPLKAFSDDDLEQNIEKIKRWYDEVPLEVLPKKIRVELGGHVTTKQLKKFLAKHQITKTRPRQPKRRFDEDEIVERRVPRPPSTAVASAVVNPQSVSHGPHSTEVARWNSNHEANEPQIGSHRTANTRPGPVTFTEFVSILGRCDNGTVQTEALPASLVQHAKECYAVYQRLAPRLDDILKLPDWHREHFEYAQAETVNNLVIELVNHIHGANHYAIGIAYSQQALVFSDKGEYSRAVNYGLHSVGYFYRLERLDDKDTLQAELNVGSILRRHGLWKDSEKACRGIFNKARRLFEHDSLTLIARHELARTLHKLGRWGEVEILLRDSIEERRAGIQYADQEWLRTALLFASTLQELGQLGRAQSLVVEIDIEINRRNYPRIMLWTFECIELHINDLILTEQFIEAQKWTQHLVFEKSRILTPEHPKVLSARQVYANILHWQSMSKSAVKHCQEVFTLRLAILGPDHPETITSKSNLACFQMRNCSFALFKATMNDVLVFRETQLGEDHIDTLRSLLLMAWVHAEDGNWDKMQRNFEVVQTKLFQLRGRKETAEYIDYLEQRAQICIERSRSKEAEPLFEECVYLKVKLYGETHPETIKSRLYLAWSLSCQDRFADAEVLASNAVKQACHKHTETSPCALHAMSIQARILECSGKRGDAIKLNQKLIQAWAIAGQQEYPEVIFAQCRLADIFAELEQYEKAEEIYNQIIEVAYTVFGEEHLCVAGLRYRIAQLMSSRKRWKEAKSEYQTALHIQKRVFGFRLANMTVFTTTTNLAKALVNLGEFEEGQRYSIRV